MKIVVNRRRGVASVVFVVSKLNYAILKKYGPTFLLHVFPTTPYPIAERHPSKGRVIEPYLVRHVAPEGASPSKGQNRPRRNAHPQAVSSTALDDPMVL